METAVQRPLMPNARMAAGFEFMERLQSNRLHLSGQQEKPSENQKEKNTPLLTSKHSIRKQIFAFVIINPIYNQENHTKTEKDSA